MGCSSNEQQVSQNWQPQSITPEWHRAGAPDSCPLLNPRRGLNRTDTATDSRASPLRRGKNCSGCASNRSVRAGSRVSLSSVTKLPWPWLHLFLCTLVGCHILRRCRQWNTTSCTHIRVSTAATMIRARIARTDLLHNTMPRAYLKSPVRKHAQTQSGIVGQRSTGGKE